MSKWEWLFAARVDAAPQYTPPSPCGQPPCYVAPVQGYNQGQVGGANNGNLRNPIQVGGVAPGPAGVAGNDQTNGFPSFVSGQNDTGGIASLYDINPMNYTGIMLPGSGQSDDRTTYENI